MSRCANEVKRTFRSNSAFLVIWASCVDTFFCPSPCVRAVFLQPSLTLPRPFPMYAAFPRSEYLWASPTSTVASASLRMVLSVGLLGRHANQDGGGSPRFLTLPFPDVPCSKTPPQSPAIIANSDRLLLPSRYSTLSACGCRLTRLNRFTCVTACPSLCLRLAHVVTSISPRLDFRWGGLTPCRCGNLTRWKRQAWPGAPK